MAKQQKPKTSVSYSSGGKNITKTISKPVKAKVDSAFKSDMGKLAKSQKTADKIGASMSAAYGGKKN